MKGPVPAATVLVAIGLHKTFRSRKSVVEAVRGVSLTLGRGEVLGFLGPNGAGKTTTLKLIAGLVRADQGRVLVLGRDPALDRMALRDVGAVLEGNRNLYWRLTAEENLQYFGVLKGLGRAQARQRTAELLQEFGLEAKRQSVVHGLSRGMQQKLALAVALVQRPTLLLLDEPTLGLDLEAAESFKERILAAASTGCTVVLSTHQLEVAEQVASRVAILRAGRLIFDGSTPELLRLHRAEEWHVDFDGPLDAGRKERLEKLGAEVHAGWLRAAAGTQTVYTLLDALRPVPVLRVEKARAGLAEVLVEVLAVNDHA